MKKTIILWVFSIFSLNAAEEIIKKEGVYHLPSLTLKPTQTKEEYLLSRKVAEEMAKKEDKTQRPWYKVYGHNYPLDKIETNVNYQTEKVRIDQTYGFVFTKYEPGMQIPTFQYVNGELKPIFSTISAKGILKYRDLSVIRPTTYEEYLDIMEKRYAHELQGREKKKKTSPTLRGNPRGKGRIIHPEKTKP